MPARRRSASGCCATSTRRRPSALAGIAADRLQLPRPIPGSRSREGADWSAAPEAAVLGEGEDPRMPVAHLLEINARTEDHPAGPRLVVDWAWPRDLLAEAEVSPARRAVVPRADRDRHARRRTSGGHTPSDFPLVRLSPGRHRAARDGRGPIWWTLAADPAAGRACCSTRGTTSATQDVYITQLVAGLSGPLDVAALRAAAASLLRRPPAAAGLLSVRGPAGAAGAARGSRLPWDDRRRRPVDDRAAAGRPTAAPVRPCRAPAAPVHPDPAGAITRTSWSSPATTCCWTAGRCRYCCESCCSGTATRRRRSAAAPYQTYLSWLARQDRAAAEEAWRELLDGSRRADPGRCRGPGATRRCDRSTSPWSCPADLTARLAAAARDHGLTLNTVVQGAWAMLLGRLTGRADVALRYHGLRAPARDRRAWSRWSACSSTPCRCGCGSTRRRRSPRCSPACRTSSPR